ncbi:MAG: hypothetical protein H0U02_11895 [Rubrobacter sp.]|nr:hypothetical protein [Rubrobacter sp.]
MDFVMEAARRNEPGIGGMHTRAAFWLAWSLAGLSVVMFAAIFPLWVLTRSAHVPASWDANLTLGDWLAGALFLIFPLVGALIASRRPGNPIGWLLLADGLLWMSSDFLDYYAIYGMAQPGSVPFPVGIAWLNNWLWVPAVGILGTYPFLLFPDGRLPSSRWRPLAWISGAVIALVSVGVAFSPGPLQGFGGVQNPFALLQPWMMLAFWAVLPLLPLCMFASAVSLMLRYRRSRGVERQQIKWIAFAASVVGLLYLIAMILSFVFPSASWFAPGSPLWMDFVDYTALLSFILIPLAVGFAVLKYRLYNIDLLINRTLVYGVLTVSLALIYLGGVATVQAIFRALTGQEQQTQLAIVASTLAIAALFNPLRTRIQSFIDRRFYRRKYDARQTLEAFSARLRNETDLDELGDDLMSVVRETMRPEHTSLWLRPDTGPKDEPAN